MGDFKIIFRSDFDVDLVEHAGSDELICKAARVSTLGAESINSEESAGLLHFLMRNRHGTPFEHSMMMYRITAPIVVWREFMRHRIGISYNEQSGRYMELFPVFYIPPPDRRLVQIGKAGHYEYVPGTEHQYSLTKNLLKMCYQRDWEAYQEQLHAGIAKEVARLCLPVAIYSTAYVTMNPRSIMNFLSLRTKDDISFFPSFPMWEINQVANKMEDLFAEHFPITHASFVKCRRIAP